MADVPQPDGPKPSRPRVLVVDDDRLIAKSCARILSEAGLECEAVDSGARAIERLEAGSYDLVLCDLVMPPPDGHAVIQRAKTAASQPAIIAVTGLNETDSQVQALKAGGWQILTKPPDPLELSRSVFWALHARAVSRRGTGSKDAEALYRIALATNSTSDLHGMLEHVLGVAVAALGADSASVMLASDAATSPRTLSVVASYGLSDLHEASTIQFGERVCGWVAANLRPLRLVGSLDRYPQFRGRRSNGDIAESLIAPIAFRGEALGTISVSRKSEGSFEPDALGFLVSASEIVAAAVHRRRVERLQEHQDRLALLGQLAASVFHELNNPITIVSVTLGEVQEMLKAPDVPPGLKAAMEPLMADALEGTKRMAALTASLRSTSRKAGNATQLVDLNTVLRRAEVVVHPQFKHRAELVVEQGSLPTVSVDPGRMLQVLINLLMNALQAVGKNGRVVLRSRTEGGFAVVDVEDNGPGVPREIAAKIFEPFFTTKPEGEGTGIGLSISRQIVAEHGGELTFTTERGQGTCFHVRLPSAGTEETKEKAKATVLVVDDEPALARAVATLLHQDFEVVMASSAADALKVAEGRRLDLILTDFAMPQQDGLSLVAALRDRGQSAPAALITAFPEDAGVEEALRRGVITRVIAKPWDALTLRAAARELAGMASGPGGEKDD